jgi:hypothetical protein
MRRILIIIIFTIFVVENSLAKAERAAVATCESRVPKIEYSQAVQIALHNGGVLTPNLKESFIDSISLECKENKQFWSIGFRQRKYESGHYIVYVYMDGSIKNSIVKDG